MPSSRCTRSWSDTDSTLIGIGICMAMISQKGASMLALMICAGRTIPIKGSRPTSQLHRSTISASPLHRVVLWTQSLGRRGYAVRSGLICELDAHDHDVGSRIALHEGIWAIAADDLMGIGITVFQHPEKRQCIVVELPA